MASFPSARRLAAIAALVALAAVPLRAQQKLLTIDDLYDPVKKVNFGPPGFGGGYTWINDKEFIRLGGGPRGAQAGGRGDVMKVDAETGTESPLYDASKLEAAVAKLPGVTAAEAARASHARGTFTRDYTGLALTIGDDIYYWPLGGDAVARLTSSPGVKEQLEFSPDGRLLAYLLNSNLYVSDVAGHERALTTDGTGKVFNGKLDWVYEEEVFGRGRPRAYWWSPDSSRIAFLQIDDTPVPTFPVVDHIPAGQVLEQTPYPRSGDPNPLVKIGVVRAGGSPVQWFDTSKYSGADHLIVEVGWTPDSKQVIFQVQNREQSWLDLDFGDVMGGDVRDALPRDDQGVGQQPGLADVAEGRHFPVVQRAERLSAPVPLQARRHAHQAGDRRQVGSTHALWGGRGKRMDLLRRHGAQLHRRRRLPREA